MTLKARFVDAAPEADGPDEDSAACSLPNPRRSFKLACMWVLSVTVCYVMFPFLSGLAGFREPAKKKTRETVPACGLSVKLCFSVSFWLGGVSSYREPAKKNFKKKTVFPPRPVSLPPLRLTARGLLLADGHAAPLLMNVLGTTTPRPSRHRATLVYSFSGLFF